MSQNTLLKSNYLQHYASTQAQQLLPTLIRALKQEAQAYHSCLCIPAFAEDRPLQSVWQHTRTNTRTNKSQLVLIFGNWPEGASQNKRQQTTQSLVDLGFNLKAPMIATDTGNKTGSPQPTIGVQRITDTSSNMTLLLLQGLKGLPPKEGVGLARRILVDIAVGLWHEGLVQSPWIGTTDADALLPQDYWEQLDAQAPPGLKVFSFYHAADETQSLANDTALIDAALIKAHRLYEHYLIQYKTALAQAFPEFGFHTLGSLYGIHAGSYEQARGYPKRAAGEDFYLLNNIAKIGTITELQHTSIRLRVRPSARTPFGTGPSVQKLLEAENMDEVPLFYCPEILQLWVQTLQSLQHSQLDWSALIAPAIKEKIAKQYQQCKTDTQRRKALICLMDGLRCQQLLRQMHENTPKLTWRELSQKTELT